MIVCSITIHNSLPLSKQVVANARRLAQQLTNAGYQVVTDGTDTHIVWLDLRSHKLSGAKAERILELVSIAVNKNTGERGGGGVVFAYA